MSKLNLLLVCVLITAAKADTIWVDAANTAGPWEGSPQNPYRFIQDGIDAAVDSDEVVVRDGTYAGFRNKDLLLGRRAIVVRSENGPDNCVIDCEDRGRGFWITTLDSPAVVLDGFTIINGTDLDANGAGLFVAASITVQDCVLTQNEASDTKYGSGGAIYVAAGTPLIQDCVIEGNDAQRGGGIFCDGNAAPVIVRCDIIENTASEDGGGVHSIGEASLTISDCLIADNEAVLSDGGGIYAVTREGRIVVTRSILDGNWATPGGAAFDRGGGGIYCDVTNGGSAFITDCLVTNNVSFHRGGGLYCLGDALVARCTIAGNWVGAHAGEGGGVFADASSFGVISNSLITSNTANGGGGGIYARSGGGSVVNSTIVGNTGWNGGGGVHCDTVLTVTNCILWDNVPGEVYQSKPDGCVIEYSTIKFGWPGEGNIGIDPVFVDPVGPDLNPATWWDNDYHLQPGSPCIDTGQPGFIPVHSKSDIDGEYRIWNGRVDMGADEYGSIPVILGDMNCDYGLDAEDIDPFFLALGDAVAYDAAYPGCDVSCGDINGDGGVDAEDVDPFFGCLSAGACP